MDTKKLADVSQIGAAKQFDNVMIDIEALGLNLRAPILSIGAVPFNMDGETNTVFYANTNPFDDAYQSSEFIDHDTLKNWMVDFSQNARNSLFDPPAQPLEVVLQEFYNWMEQNISKYVWARGPQFDLRVIEFAYSVVITGGNHEIDRLEFDWYRVRDERSYTLDLPHDWNSNPSNNENKHNAIADCMWQIRRIAYINNLHQELIEN